MFVISKTHVGMVRTVNEDALLTTGPEPVSYTHLTLPTT